MSDEATDRQLVGLGMVAAYIAERGVPPTLREIAAALGMGSTNGVNDLLIALEKKGLVVRTPMISRGLRVTELGYQLLGAEIPVPRCCPTCGRPL